MYYLNSRYYDPNVGRFISPDSLKYLEPNVINGLNLYCYCMNDPIFYYDPSGKSVTLLPMFKILNLFIMISDRFVLKNKFDMHYEGSKDYGEGDAFIFSKDKIAIVDWEKSWYRGNLYFDKNEVYSGYFGVGNSSLYFGYNKKKKQIGFFADVNAFSAGYDGKYLDAGISVIGTGMIFAYEDGKVRIKFDPPGFIGVNISIDFSEIISDLW